MPPTHPFAAARLCAGASVLALLSSMLVGCGVESAGTAAAIGVGQKNEIERGREVQKQVQQQLQQSAEQAQQRADPLANGY